MNPSDIPLSDLRQIKWTKRDSYPAINNIDSASFSIKLSKNTILYEKGQWVDMSNPLEKPTTINTLVSENEVLKRRIDTLTRTAAISYIEVKRLKEEIEEAKHILEQLSKI